MRPGSNTGRTPGGAVVYEHDDDVEFAAHEALPGELRWAIAHAPLKISAVEVRQVLERAIATADEDRQWAKPNPFLEDDEQEFGPDGPTWEQIVDRGTRLAALFYRARLCEFLGPTWEGEKYFPRAVDRAAECPYHVPHVADDGG